MKSLSPEKRSAWATLILRLGFGGSAFYIGLQNSFGLLGGTGFHSTIVRFDRDFGIPPALGLFIIVAELVGGLWILIGWLTTFASFIVCLAMLVEIGMGWRIAAQHEPFVQSLRMLMPHSSVTSYILPGVLAIMLLGAGPFSVDGKSTGKRSKKR